MRKLSIAFAALAFIAAPAAAQDHDEGHMAESGGPMADIKPLQDQFMGWVLQAAKDMPQDKYSFRPVEGVRSFGELIGHVANANFTFCSIALDEDRPQQKNFETVTDRAELIEATERAIEYCGRAYDLPHRMAHDEKTVFGQKGSLTWLLAWNTSHNSEHYGNIVTYLRISGMVPPSSQGN